MPLPYLSILTVGVQPLVLQDNTYSRTKYTFEKWMLVCSNMVLGTLAERLRQQFAKLSLSNRWIGSIPICSAIQQQRILICTQFSPYSLPVLFTIQRVSVRCVRRIDHINQCKYAAFSVVEAPESVKLVD